MYLIAGLGNYPKEYDLTRHNMGFMCVDNFVKKYETEFKTESKFKAEIAACNFNNEKIIIAKPLTFMNLSGEAIQKISAFYKIEPQNIFIIYDDISLDVGKIRFRAKGSDGGHNGIKSIIAHASTQEFGRMKIGIGPQPPYMKSEDYVLQNFSKEEFEILIPTLDKCVDAFLFYCDTNCDIQKVQNKYN